MLVVHDGADEDVSELKVQEKENEVMKSHLMVRLCVYLRVCQNSA